MPPSYSVTVERERSLLRLTPAGFFDMAIVRRFAAERDAAVRSMTCRRNQHVTIIDVRDQMISPPDVAAEFTRLIQDPRFASRRLAFVVTGALPRAQSRRIAQRDNVGFFDTVEEAEAWLFEVPSVTTAI